MPSAARSTRSSSARPRCRRCAMPIASSVYSRTIGAPNSSSIACVRRSSRKARCSRSRTSTASCACRCSASIADEPGVIVATNKGEPLALDPTSQTGAAYRAIAAKLDGRRRPRADRPSGAVTASSRSSARSSEDRALMFDFFRSLFGPPPPSGATAKERLRLVLLSDHLSLAPDVVEALKRDLLEVISRYVEIDHGACGRHLRAARERESRCSRTSRSRACANASRARRRRRAVPPPVAPPPRRRTRRRRRGAEASPDATPRPAEAAPGRTRRIPRRRSRRRSRPQVGGRPTGAASDGRAPAEPALAAHRPVPRTAVRRGVAREPRRKTGRLRTEARAVRNSRRPGVGSRTA